MQMHIWESCVLHDKKFKNFFNFFSKNFNCLLLPTFIMQPRQTREMTNIHHNISYSGSALQMLRAKTREIKVSRQAATQ